MNALDERDIGTAPTAARVRGPWLSGSLPALGDRCPAGGSGWPPGAFDAGSECVRPRATVRDGAGRSAGVGIGPRPRRWSPE